jgi:hypothetical protein
VALQSTLSYNPPTAHSLPQPARLQSAHHNYQKLPGSFQETSGKVPGRGIWGRAGGWLIGGLEGTEGLACSVLTCSWAVLVALPQTQSEYLQTAQQIGQIQSGSLRKPTVGS